MGYLYLSDPERLHGMMAVLGLGDAPAMSSSSSGSLASGSSLDAGSSLDDNS